MAACEQQGIDLVVGSHASAVSQAAAAVATEQGQLFWETGAVGETLPGTSGGRNFFRMAPMGSNLGSTAIDFVAHQVAPHLGSTAPLRYAVAYVDDPYGREVGNGAIAEIEKLGRPLVGTFAYDAAHGRLRRAGPAHRRGAPRRAVRVGLHPRRHRAAPRAGGRARAAAGQHRHLVELLHAGSSVSRSAPTPSACSPRTSRTPTT